MKMLFEGDITLDNQISPERETSFLGYLPAQRVKHQHVAKYPSFDRYRKHYLKKYGLDEPTFNSLRTKFNTSIPHQNSGKNFKKWLGEWLFSFQEVRMVEWAHQYTQNELGGVLVYRQKDGTFDLHAPKFTSPTQNGVDETIRTPVKEIRALRKSLSPDDKMTVKTLDVSDSFIRLSPTHAGYSFFPTREFDEENPHISVTLSALLSMVKEKRCLALKEALKQPKILAIINNTLNVLPFVGVSLLHVAVICNNPKALQLLLDCPSVDPNPRAHQSTLEDEFNEYRFYENVTPLHVALLMDCIECTKILIRHDRTDRSATACVVYHKDKLDEDILQDEDIDQTTDDGVIGAFRYRSDFVHITREVGLTVADLALEHCGEEIQAMVCDYTNEELAEEPRDSTMEIIGTKQKG